MNQRRTTKRIDRAALLREEIHQIQGETPGVPVAGKSYVYKLLKRRACQRTLYNLVPPFIDLVNVVMESAATPLQNMFKALMKGEKSPDFDFDELDFSKFNLGAVSGALRNMPFDEFWDLASALLNGVSIDGQQYGKLDDHEYYDAKQPELIQAMLMGLRVNYPHLAALIKPADGGGDTTPDETAPEGADE